MVELIWPVLTGVTDRIRGNAWRMFGSIPNNRTLEKLVYGYCIAGALGHHWDALTVPLMFLAAVGMSPGWGEPLGAALSGREMRADNYERWQVFKITQKNVWAALFVRGCIAGGIILPMGYYDPSIGVVVLAYGLAFPVGTYLAKISPTVLWDNPFTEDRWGLSELLRGVLTGVVCTLGVGITS